MKNRVYIIIFVIIFLSTFVSDKAIKTSVEELQVPLGVGVDLKQNDFNDFYDVTVNTYVFESNENILTKNRNGYGITLGNARQDRQLREDKQYIIGQEKVFVISEDYAKYGVKTYFDFVFRNSLINDKTSVVVCEGKASDILKLNIENYISPIEFIQGLANQIDSEHFSNKENKIIDTYTRINSKYRNLILPYISIVKDKIEIKGYALFDEDQMKVMVDPEEGKFLNLLRDDSGYGTITIFDSPSKALDLYGNCKKKVTCSKEKDTYQFAINLDLKMSVSLNELNNDLSSNLKVKKELEKLAKTQIENECSKFISKMQNTYKVDYLDLKRVLVAKYGRNIDSDLNRLICNSKIDVKAKVTIVNYGRGEY